MKVVALDDAYTHIARDLHTASTASNPEAVAQLSRKLWPKYIISNNKRNGEGRGEHWFTVAYSIRRRPLQLAAQQGIAASVQRGDGSVSTELRKYPRDLSAFTGYFVNNGERIEIMASDERFCFIKSGCQFGYIKSEYVSRA